jgi:protein ImuA
LGERWFMPAPLSPTLSELFAAHPRDGGWAGFLLAQLGTDKPLLWVQDRMAILESGRIHPPGLPTQDLIHVETRDARDALWAMEEGVRCSALSAVIGEIWGDPRALDFTATRRLAVASERGGTPCWLVRLGGTANLSGARMRWRIASAPSLLNSLDPRAPGLQAWDAELFRARGMPPGRWSVAHEADRFHLVAAPGDRALGEEQRLRA